MRRELILLLEEGECYLDFVDRTEQKFLEKIRKFLKDDPEYNKLSKRSAFYIDYFLDKFDSSKNIKPHENRNSVL